MRFGEFELQPGRRELLQCGRPVKLGARAFDLLCVLVARRRRVVLKRELMDLVWPGLVVEENNMAVQINSLRKVFGPQAIFTVPGRGYRWMVQIDLDDAGDPSDPGATPLEGDASSRSGNLPPVLEAPIGREADLTTLRQALWEHRLVSIVGAGGIGKTCVANASADAARSTFADGVWLVDLAPIADPERVVPAVALAFGIKVGDNPSALDLVTQALASKQLLLVLDNCEHLVDAVSSLVQSLLSTSAQLKILTTTQEALRLPFEHVLRLSTLSLPETSSLADAQGSGAVQLFVKRARAVTGAFALDDSSASSVVEICRRLDGVALAIELAAARLPLLGLTRLREGLDERFRMLSGGSRFALRRHQTLRASLEWSHGLLADPERRVFRRLAVFVGTLSLESARIVAGDATMDGWEVVDHLGVLVDKSLVAVEATEPPRYRLLETVRAFAMEKLAEAGETDISLRRHAQAMLELACEWRRIETKSSRFERITRYLLDLDNLRAAISFARRSDKSGLFPAIVAASSRIWYSLMHLMLVSEGIDYLREALKFAEPDTALDVRADCARDLFLLASTHVLSATETRHLGEVAIDLIRRSGDHRSLYRTLCVKAEFLSSIGEPSAARTALDEALALEPSILNPGERPSSLATRARLALDAGQFDVARDFFSRLEEERDREGDLIGRIYAFEAIVETHLARMDIDTAIAEGRRGLEVASALPTHLSFENKLKAALIGPLALRGQISEAADLAITSLPWLRNMGELESFFDRFALLAFERGRAEVACRLVGFTDRRLLERGYKRGPFDGWIRTRLQERLNDALGVNAVSGLISEGETADLYRASELAAEAAQPT